MLKIKFLSSHGKFTMSIKMLPELILECSNKNSEHYTWNNVHT